MNKNLKISEIKDELLKSSSFAIICHTRPDGDAIGSSSALKKGLISIGKRADVFCEDPVPEKFSYLGVINDYSSEIKGEYDAYVAVDCADEARLGFLSEIFCKKRNTFNIDHHVSNTRYAKFNYVFDNSSNAENIYDLLKAIGVNITKDIAMCLMTGICTDTGNFSHKNVTERSLSVSSDLVKCGADLNLIYNETFVKQSKNRAKLFSMFSGNLRYFLDDRLCIGIITKEMFDKSGAGRDDTEGFIDFALSIDCVGVAVSVMEVGDKKYKISFRSKELDVNEIAGVFGGGGHVLASGCMICGYLEDVIDRIVFAVKQRI
ncbi:MAG TPA: hypothetical protein DHU65_05610 [Clostridiales bacterium]|nr:hypothetical protein [Clostridiales bacterium]